MHTYFGPALGFVTDFSKPGKVIGMDALKPFDPNCGRTPVEIGEYDEYAKEDYEDNGPGDLIWDNLTDVQKEEMINDYVRYNEGTYNPNNGHFACTQCYITMGQPSAPYPGWKMP